MLEYVDFGYWKEYGYCGLRLWINDNDRLEIMVYLDGRGININRQTTDGSNCWWHNILIDN